MFGPGVRLSPDLDSAVLAEDGNLNLGIDPKFAVASLAHQSLRLVASSGLCNSRKLGSIPTFGTLVKEGNTSPHMHCLISLCTNACWREPTFNGFEGKIAILIDNLADTNNTTTPAPKLLKMEGETIIHALVTHRVRSGDVI